jgi:2-C-methyl-D-erythritol 2,4-cyclodiphosphate synthase
MGYDIHRLIPGRRLLLGGVDIPSDVGEDAHSDGDVLLHAVIDALLGAAVRGDIGTLFPPEDPRYAGISSRILLERVRRLLEGDHLAPAHLDCTVILQAPRLRPHVDRIRETLAADLGMPAGSVSVKAKTKEGLDAVGHGVAVEAYAVVLLEPRPPAGISRLSVGTQAPSSGTSPSLPPRPPAPDPR